MDILPKYAKSKSGIKFKTVYFDEAIYPFNFNLHVNPS